MDNELARHGIINFEYFSAIDGRDPGYDFSRVYNRDLSLEIYKRELVNSEIACALSHEALYKKILLSKVPQVILEDDILITDEYLNSLPVIEKEISKGNTIVYLGYYSNADINDKSHSDEVRSCIIDTDNLYYGDNVHLIGRDMHLLVKNFDYILSNNTKFYEVDTKHSTLFCTHGYIPSFDVMSGLLREIKLNGIYAPIDEIIFKYVRDNDVRVLAPTDRIVHQVPTIVGSDIHLERSLANPTEWVQGGKNEN